MKAVFIHRRYHRNHSRSMKKNKIMLYFINFCIIHKKMLEIYKYSILVFYSNNTNAAAFTDEIIL